MASKFLDLAGLSRFYAGIKEKLNSHVNNAVVHVTDNEREVWNEKQSSLTFDDTPTEDSINPVTSGGLFTSLSNKAAKSVQDTVEAKTRQPNISATVAASDLQAYLDALPRLLTSWYGITVTGTTEDVIYLRYFYGPGSIRIAGSSGSAVGGFNINQCTISLQIWNIDIQPPAGATSPCVTGEGIQYARFYGCRLIGNGFGRGVGCGEGNRLILENCQISNCTTAVFAGRNTTISVKNDIADAAGIRDNQTGCHVWYGGIILLCVAAPDLMGGASNVKDGGIISKANGTLL